MNNSQQPINPTIVDVESEQKNQDWHYDSINGNIHYYGLTKREYFAGLAMQGYMAHRYTPHQDPNNVAEYAIMCADELLKQLEKQP
jgi:hypothetical protein